MALFRKKEKRAEGETVPATHEQVEFQDNLLQALIGGETKITKKTAMEIPTVQACINLIANIISLLPVKLYEETDGEVKEITDDIRVKLLNGDTGDTINGTELRKLWVMDYFLGKGSYTYIDRDIYGMPKGLYYVDETRISVIPDNKAIFKDYAIMADGAAYFRSDFLKILRNSKGNGIGTSVIEESNIILLVAYNTLKFENSNVKKGGNKKGFLTSQKQQTEKSMSAVKKAWKRMFSNSQDVEDNVIVLNEGMDFKETSATSVEMQLNESKQTNAAEICKLFSVPPEIFSGKITDGIRDSLVSDSITPVANVIEAALDRDLLLESEKGRKYFALDMRELTRGNILQRYQAYEIGIKNDFLQADEVREREDLKPLGFNFIKLGLQDVLLDPETKRIYTPNTNALFDFGAAQAGYIPLDGENRAAELRFNPNHDPMTGQFSSGAGYGGFSDMSGYADDGRQASISGVANKFSNGGTKPVDKSENNDKIRNELNEAIKSGKISTKLDKDKQGGHRKGNPEYEKRISRGEHPSYVTVSNMEIQKIINETSGKGELHQRPDGQFIEVISWKSEFGVMVEKHTTKELPTNRGMIHYSKDGTHLVPTRPKGKGE